MRRIVIVAVVGLLAGTAFSQMALAAPPDGNKTQICHYNADDDPDAPQWELLEIKANNAVAKHMEHGDVLPGTAGLDGNCQPTVCYSNGFVSSRLIEPLNTLSNFELFETLDCTGPAEIASGWAIVEAATAEAAVAAYLALEPPFDEVLCVPLAEEGLFPVPADWYGCINDFI